MKKISLSLMALVGLGMYAHAGGDIAPITFYETEDEVLASEAKLLNTPMVEEERTVVKPELIAPLPSKKMEEKVVPKPLPMIATASSQKGLYAGAGVSVVRYDTNCACRDTTLSGTDKTLGILAKLGYEVNDHVAFETRGMVTFLEDDGGKVNHIGIFVKPSYPIDAFNLYGLVGWGQSKTSGSLRETDVNGLAWGGGVAYDLTETLSLFIDYERLFEKSEAPDLDSINMGMMYHF